MQSKRPQDKLAELEASGKVLERIDSEVWDRHLRYKQLNLERAGMTRLKAVDILDFGCGPGTFGVLMGMANHVGGVDIARQAVEQAIARGKKFGSDLDIINADGESLCLRPGGFDVCFSGWVIHHFPNPEVIFASFYRLLRPGGMVVLIEPNESSLPLRVSRIVEGILNRPVIKGGLDTPNRRTHTLAEYEHALSSSGFRLSNEFSYFNGEMPELPRNLGCVEFVVLKVLIYARQLWLSFCYRVFKQGTELFIIARKQV